jgi:DNA-directed RNA polymerase specialized sigma24 family protein
MQHKDDYQLVQRVLRKNRQAFEDFFEAYFARLFRFCSVRVSQTDAESGQLSR